jgi:quercetin dioxygenase-like cupin family protein
MENLNRRDLLVALTAMAAITADAQVIAPHAMGEKMLDQSHAWTLDELPLKPNANGGDSHAIVDGALPTGEKVEMHETRLPPGQMPHPAHKHRHSEFMLIRQGTVEWELDGGTKKVGAGGVCFAASGQMHGIKNVGEGDAIYFVVSIGRDAVGAVPVKG